MDWHLHHQEQGQQTIRKTDYIFPHGTCANADGEE